MKGWINVKTEAFVMPVQVSQIGAVFPAESRKDGVILLVQGVRIATRHSMSEMEGMLADAQEEEMVSGASDLQVAMAAVEKLGESAAPPAQAAAIPAEAPSASFKREVKPRRPK